MYLQSTPTCPQLRGLEQVVAPRVKEMDEKSQMDPELIEAMFAVSLVYSSAPANSAQVDLTARLSEFGGRMD